MIPTNKTMAACFLNSWNVANDFKSKKPKKQQIQIIIFKSYEKHKTLFVFFTDICMTTFLKIPKLKNK